MAKISKNLKSYSLDSDKPKDDGIDPTKVKMYITGEQFKEYTMAKAENRDLRTQLRQAEYRITELMQKVAQLESR